MEPAVADASDLARPAPPQFTGAHEVKTVSSQGARHCSRSLPWRSILLIAAAVTAYGFAGPAPGDWVFDRLAIEQGEWWRLITGHWVHSGPEHAAWNIAALGLFAACRWSCWPPPSQWTRGCGGVILHCVTTVGCPESSMACWCWACGRIGGKAGIPWCC
jgi:hypothetical protein